MFSTLVEWARRTAAWRLSVFTTVAFALATAGAFLIAYSLVSREVRSRSDVWLRGEIQVLADVARFDRSTGPADHRLRRAARDALREVGAGDGHEGFRKEVQAFFLAIDRDGTPRIWLGPGDGTPFRDALYGASDDSRSPRSVQVAGFEHPFRVSAYSSEQGSVIYLGLSDGDARALMDRVTRSFAALWGATILAGFVISFMSARSILRRVDRITEAAAQVGQADLHGRVPEGLSRDEISHLAATFNGMLDRIRRMVEQTHTIADGVAHDLLSPVTSVRGRLELALANGKAEDLEEAAEAAIEGLGRLRQTLIASLDVAEAEAGTLRLRKETVDVGLLVREMAEIYRPAAEERGITLDLRCGSATEAFVDPELTRRAIANLLDNAVQHLPQGSTVLLAARRNQDMIELDVSDDGPGIPADLRDRVFDRYSRGDGSRGHGLGLALVRAIARANGGEASLSDSAEGGALIHISLPASA